MSLRSIYKDTSCIIIDVDVENATKTERLQGFKILGK